MGFFLKIARGLDFLVQLLNNFNRLDVRKFDGWVFVIERFGKIRHNALQISLEIEICVEMGG